MDNDNRHELSGLLKTLPPIDFCFMYGSSLHPNNNDKSSMIDYILGVSDPQQWHSENLQLNRDHYASWLMRLGGARLVTGVADGIGVGVHFNPFITYGDKMYKYGVVRVDDLIQDILDWKTFYLSGRLQKPEDLYTKICSLSYMGDLRMFFAEDKNKVKKIVQGQYNLFQTMYKSCIEDYASKELLRFSSSGNNQVHITQDCGLSATSTLVSSLPGFIRSEMGIKLGEKMGPGETGQIISKVVTGSRQEAAECMQKILRKKVMVSSGRQAVAGLLTVGAVHGARYLANKVKKAWRSWS
ncbi:uncharacterized protein LOC108213493 isoform X3 [Daucus carota subsp. sativus]|uniref:uncharacterized protein LOC108213493 isoform X3 n=1 Tax=Daucus carota subsp. sativus TaxID=79200 RepID=UPI0007EFE792|nr:PREDICTED: phosphatidate cytidylyltransferase, mitochondrial isoform X2 [Daucus carota subsp. sativus]